MAKAEAVAQLSTLGRPGNFLVHASDRRSVAGELTFVNANHKVTTRGIVKRNGQVRLETSTVWAASIPELVSKLGRADTTDIGIKLVTATCTTI
ncbi:hypothetical protein PTSG_01728 [Salpingoeca rosetta]|uniref:SH2 domain-containing protein n=1 Tax=Salpingoeca rosetta (strain ATCC 50818 / BSB-021) TaxID=946362 RepID=F2TYS5_SALR5|nr:uncharacterized protein PTSG_01728 [Salpingoeca rosetta]EGD78749.1 hypothetical protein PTSG_01728 [Salpingoeca rosetta]|eukprot:XP_004997706.1 hypothetical protein PTSG_01728 [Salpingoeca rosetta]